VTSRSLTARQESVLAKEERWEVAQRLRESYGSCGGSGTERLISTSEVNDEESESEQIE
jgi:hypothetical protein